MNLLTRVVLSTVLVSVSLGTLHAQDVKQRNQQTLASITKMVADSNLVFKAEYVLVSGGSVGSNGDLFNGTNNGPNELVSLNSNSYLTINPTVVTACLPWIDQNHYTKPATDKYSPQTAEGKGFKYNVKNFNYTVKQLKGGEYEITISPRNAPRSRYFLEVDTDGKAKLTLYLGGTSVSYRGSITQQI